MYAIVDIETTGGNASSGGITEVAIVLHNGLEVEGKFETLINPEQHIPAYITALTGISNYMLADAPTFPEVADRIFRLLQGRVFVAHNVNFDFSFLHHHLQMNGYQWQAKKLCTVRYARKVVPGLPSYSLGNLCRSVGIDISNRHRAGGDVMATAELFEHLLANDSEQKHLQHFLKGKTPDTYLPMHVPAEQLHQLPFCPGVYYFKDQQGKVVYVGKAKNLKYRVRSHFANNSGSKRKQDFIRLIHNIEYKACLTEMHALVLEELEIKRLWPLYNRSQKRPVQLYGLYALHDQRGFMRLAVEKRKKNLPAIASFHRSEEGYMLGRKLMQQFDINEQLLFVTGQVLEPAEHYEQHNGKMEAAIDFLQEQLPTCVMYEWGETEKGEPATVLYSIEKGLFTGWAIIPQHVVPIDRTAFNWQTCSDNEYIRAMLFRFADAHPQQCVLNC